MAELPGGTVTFAFTDIEGSTSLLKRLGDDYGEVLSTHRRLVRDAFTSWSGVEIDTQGDAFFFAFVRARDAVQAAVEVQRAHASHPWRNGEQVRMRLGLHTGEPTLGEEGYLGIDVVRAARLCSSSVGGQVLLSETTRALVGSKLPDGVSVFPLGERHLKDIDEPERVYELGIEGLATQEAGPGPAATDTRSSDAGAIEGMWEQALEQRADKFAERLSNRVFSAVERMFGGTTEPVPEEPGGLNDIVSRAGELAQRIRAEIDEHQRPPP